MAALSIQKTYSYSSSAEDPRLALSNSQNPA